MATEEEGFLKAVKKLREAEEKREAKRNFDQTIDLIVNLKDFDVRRDAFNIFIQLPHKVKDKKIVGFFEGNSELVKVIKKEEFVKFKEKKDMRNLIKNYDFFIANAKLMPTVATSFGRVLGPAGKMPSPQLGILVSEEEKAVKGIIERANSSIRIRVKEASIKAGIAKESLKDEEIMQNALTVYNKILENLPRKRDHVKKVQIKLTMGKPIEVEI